MIEKMKEGKIKNMNKRIQFLRQKYKNYNQN